MQRLRKRNVRIDRLEHDARRNRRKGSLGKWIYLLVLLGLLLWLLEYFLGNLIFFEAQGFVVRDQHRVAVPYPAQLVRLDAEVGDRLATGSQVAQVHSLSIRETIAQLSLRMAEIRREISELSARRTELDALIPLAELRAERMRGLLEQNNQAYETGLTTAINRTRLIEDEFNAAEKLAVFRAEKQEIGQQIALLREQAAELGRQRDLFADAYRDGVVSTPIAGDVFDIEATVGGVVRAADPIMTLVTGEPYILAYITPGGLDQMPVGARVRIEFGVQELTGRISRILPLSKQLPIEFQRQFRPQERSQLIRIDLEDAAAAPPTFTKVVIRSARFVPRWLADLLGLEDPTPPSAEQTDTAAQVPAR